MQTGEKIPRKKFSNNLDSNNFETKQSEKIQNILPFPAEESKYWNGGEGEEVRGATSERTICHKTIKLFY